MRVNNDIIWNVVGLVLIVFSFLLLNIDNPNNTWNKVVLSGLFFSLLVKLIYTITQSKKNEKV